MKITSFTVIKLQSSLVNDHLYTVYTVKSPCLKSIIKVQSRFSIIPRRSPLGIYKSDLVHTLYTDYNICL